MIEVVLVLPEIMDSLSTDTHRLPAHGVALISFEITY